MPKHTRSRPGQPQDRFNTNQNANGVEDSGIVCDFILQLDDANKVCYAKVDLSTGEIVSLESCLEGTYEPYPGKPVPGGYFPPSFTNTGFAFQLQNGSIGAFSTTPSLEPEYLEFCNSSRTQLWPWVGTMEQTYFFNGFEAGIGFNADGGVALFIVDTPYKPNPTMYGCVGSYQGTQYTLPDVCSGPNVHRSVYTNFNNQLLSVACDSVLFLYNITGDAYPRSFEQYSAHKVPSDGVVLGMRQYYEDPGVALVRHKGGNLTLDYFGTFTQTFNGISVPFPGGDTINEVHSVVAVSTFTTGVVHDDNMFSWSASTDLKLNTVQVKGGKIVIAIGWSSSR